MRVVIAAEGMVVDVVRQHCRLHLVMMPRHVMYRMRELRRASVGVYGSAIHRDGSKRLNRQAQCQQQNDE